METEQPNSSSENLRIIRCPSIRVHADGLHSSIDAVLKPIVYKADPDGYWLGVYWKEDSVSKDAVDDLCGRVGVLGTQRGGQLIKGYYARCATLRARDENSLIFEIYDGKPSIIVLAAAERAQELALETDIELTTVLDYQRRRSPWPPSLLKESPEHSLEGITTLCTRSYKWAQWLPSIKSGIKTRTSKVGDLYEITWPSFLESYKSTEK